MGDISDKKMDVEYVFTASAIILGIFTVILQVVSYLLLSGTIAYMTISGIWGGFATIVAAMAAQKKHFLKSQACAILAIVGGTVMIGPYYWSFENNFPRFEFDCSQYWKGFCETKTAMDVFFFIFGILTVALNGLLIIGTTKKQK